jgi:hypothetical protein
MINLVANFIQKLYSFSPKQFAVITAVFMLTVLSAAGAGLALKQDAGAAVARDCDHNSIDYADANGGCGAANATELVADIKDNKPSDIKTIYSHFGLTSTNYNDFIKEAVQGEFKRNGDIVVDGKVVATDAWSMGRTTLGGSQRTPISINGVTYYHSASQDSFGSGVTSIPTLVWFDANGVVKAGFMNPCGNPVTKWTKVTPKATCKAISAAQPDKTNKPNTYKFTTDATFTGNATFSRVVYTFSDDNTIVEKKSLTDAVEHTFKKSGKVTATVYAKVPGGAEIKASVINCEKQITYVPPMFTCVNLAAVALDAQKRSFRFTVKVKMDATTSLKSVDYNLDGTNTTTGVTAKDKDGNVYKDYNFTDEKTHNVKVTVFFNTSEGIQSKSCEASVTPSKLPKCTVPGHEDLEPTDVRCGYCKEGIPLGDSRCEDKPQILAASTKMPDTGPGDVAGIFAGTSALGFLGHKLYLRRKRNQ